MYTTADAGTPEEEYANRYYFYHYDIRGSVTNIVGDDGKLVKGYEYDEYGNTTDGGEESFINEVTFTGSVRDLGSGLQYMNARYYDPATGRFVSQDTYTGTPYAPWTQHLYSYCGNNPVNMVDPTGHMPIKPIAVNDGGSTRVVPEPTGSGEELVQVNGEISWWNDTYEPSFYWPTFGEMVTDTASIILGSSLGLSKDIIVGLSPRRNGRTVWPNRTIAKGLGIAGTLLSGVTLGFDIANTWTTDGYTNGERVVRTGAQIAEAGANAVVGFVAGQAVKAVGYFIGGSTVGVAIIMIVVGGLIIASGSYGVDKASESLYRQYLDWRTSGNLYKDPSVKVM